MIGGSASRQVSSSEEKKDVVERVRPGGDAEPASDEERAEEDARDEPKGERAGLEGIAERADVVEQRKR